uniref:Uncharacterized protein n=1 Tax=Bionectria ochroleuca TaxID=29856 RepID=A0A8H7K1E2_BIOOC
METSGKRSKEAKTIGHPRQSPANSSDIRCSCADQCGSGTNICSSRTDICCSGPLECSPSFECCPTFERSTAIQCPGLGILCCCTQRGPFGERTGKPIFCGRSFVPGAGILVPGGTHFGGRTNLTSGHLWRPSHLCGNSTILTSTSNLTSTSVISSTCILTSTSVLTATSTNSQEATQGSSASRGSGTTLATATSGGSQTVGGSATSRSGSAATTTTTSSATAAVSSAKLDAATVGQNAAVTQVSGNLQSNGRSSFTVEAQEPADVKPGESIRVLATIVVGPSGNGKRAFLDRRQSGGVCQLQMQIDGTSVYDAQVSAAGAGGATMDIATNGAQAATDMPKINVTQIYGSMPVEVTVTNMFVTSVNGGVMNPDVGPSSTGSGGGNNGGSTTSGTRTGSSTTSTQSATGGGNNNNNNGAGHSALDASRSSIWALCLMDPAVVLAI